LSWDEYLDQLLARLAGDGHEDDARGQGSLEYIDPMAAYIYSWSRDMDWWIGDQSPTLANKGAS
jgi:hypothetical protein